MKVGKEFGAICIGVLTNHSKEELLNSGANYAVKMNRVIQLIEKRDL